MNSSSLADVALPADGEAARLPQLVKKRRHIATTQIFAAKGLGSGFIEWDDKNLPRQCQPKVANLWRAGPRFRPDFGGRVDLVGEKFAFAEESFQFLRSSLGRIGRV